jgi:hypothetical protein
MNMKTREEIREKILGEIEAERMRQIVVKKRTPESDESNTGNDWVAYIASCVGRATENMFNQRNGLGFRENMIKVAALAVAAIEWYDRKQQ